jgi:hypothetical protein
VLLPGAAPGHVMLEMQAAHTLVLSAAIDHLGAGASPAPAPAP